GSGGSIKGVEAGSVYSGSKAAVRSFARCWTTELRHRKIRVNAISAGPTQTPGFNKPGGTREQIDEMKANVIAAVPLGRMGTPDEVANALYAVEAERGGGTVAGYVGDPSCDRPGPSLAVPVRQRPVGARPGRLPGGPGGVQGPAHDGPAPRRVPLPGAAAGGGRRQRPPDQGRGPLPRQGSGLRPGAGRRPGEAG